MKNRKKARRIVICAVVAVLLVAAVTAGSVVAYLKTTATNSVENEFSAAVEVDPTINETFDGTVKQNVSVNVGDTGGYAVYVRAAIVITWKNGEDGSVLGQPPVEGDEYDYEIVLGENWFKKDNFYYCKTPVESGDDSSVLIELVKLNSGVTSPESGYTFNVEIISQTIQAAGKTDIGDTPAVTDAWGISVDSNGKLIQP